jgi:hypothetical protein
MYGTRLVLHWDDWYEATELLRRFYGFSRGHKRARWKNKETDSMPSDAL